MYVFAGKENEARLNGQVHFHCQAAASTTRYSVCSSPVFGTILQSSHNIIFVLFFSYAVLSLLKILT